MRWFIYIMIISSFLTCTTPKSEYVSPKFIDIAESVYAPAVVKTTNQYMVHSQSNGIIDSVFIIEGMRIKENDTLFLLDNRSHKINTENAKLTSINLDYDRNKYKLNEAKNSIRIAEQNFENDSIAYVRQKNLWNNDIGSKVELEQKQLKYENALLNLKNAELNYKDLKTQLKLNSDQAKNNYEIAKISQDNSLITSKINGIVYKVNYSKGELFTNANPLAIIGTDEFYLELDIDEVDITKIKLGQKVVVKMNSYKDKIFEAQIYSLDPMMNERTRSFKAKAKFTESPKELFLNLTAETNVVIRTKEKALTIPKSCLLNDSTVMLKDKTEKRIKIGLKDYEVVEILDGIDEKSEIIILE